MSTVRVVPLGAPIAAGLWVGGELAAVLLSLVGVALLLLLTRAAHFRVQAMTTPSAGRHRRS